MPLRGLLAVLAVVLAAAAGWYFFVKGGKLDLNAPTVSRDITPVPGPGIEVPQLPPDVPSFDIVRIDATGRAVISGHAKGGAKVTALGGGKALADTVANARGEWVIVVPQPLRSGIHELGIRAEDKGGEAVASPQTVVADLQPGGRGLVVLQTPGQSSRVLQRGDDPPTSELALQAADVDEAGKLLLSGTATANAFVRVYLDNEPVGVAKTSGRGNWSLAPAGVAPGAYTMRIDELGAGTAVAARMEIAFERVDPALVVKPLVGKNNLAVVATATDWRIARAIAGSGYRYTVIYKANQGQIRDASLIYPGQVFDEPAASAPVQ